ncbi:MAG: hypothetical protein WA510_22645 [Acidobacteriaceae bacterium]
MKKIAHGAKPPTDGAYLVSAADVADKLIERMSRGQDPWLFARSAPALVSGGEFLPVRSRTRFD